MKTNGLRNTLKKSVEYLFNAGTLAGIAARGRRRIYVMLTPQYLNYGDHAIAYAELRWLEKAFPDWEIFEINYNVFELWPDRVIARVTDEDVIVVTGGGFMGNLWPENERLTERIIEAFPNNWILFAPQTLFFRDTPGRAADEARLASLLRRHGNFFFFCRDAGSCDAMARLGFAEGRDYRLFPDFVLFMPNDFPLERERKGTLICLRQDGEGVVDRETILRGLDGGDVREIRMAVDHAEIPQGLRRSMLERKLGQYAGARLVVTDRLHAMLFAAFTGTPCVAFDNISRKVSGVHEWIASLDYIAVTDDPARLPSLVKAVGAKAGDQNRAGFLALQEALKAEYMPRFAEQINRRD